jgi:predicted transglutaminase-like cysteine proteinase
MKHLLLPLFLSLTFSGLAVGEAAAAPQVTAMPLGPRTAPPAGYAAFCAQHPEECGAPAAAAGSPPLARFWSAVFQDDSPTGDLSAATPTRLPLNRNTDATLDRVNREVNQLIHARPDAKGSDIWSLPLEEGRREGDCEDYVLEKRHALIAAGVPYAALSIAVVRTVVGEPHAVLIVATDGGDVVLDNRSPWVLPWREADYAWVKRQSPTDPDQWVQLSGLTGRNFRNR